MSRRVIFDISSLHVVHQSKLKVSKKSSLLESIIHLTTLRTLVD